MSSSYNSHLVPIPASTAMSSVASIASSPSPAVVPRPAAAASPAHLVLLLLDVRGRVAQQGATTAAGTATGGRAVAVTTVAAVAPRGSARKCHLSEK